MEQKTQKIERAVLVGLDCPKLGRDTSTDETLDELEELLKTAGGMSVGKVLQRRDSPDPATFAGEGKILEAARLARDNDAELMIFDNELSPSQLRNIAKLTDLVVLDRSTLILDIFAGRARTSEGRLQVELAQYRYMLSKLSGLGKSMSRLGGGIGTRGPGESKLETDRRHIRRHITHLEEEFERIRRVRATQAKQRLKSGIPSAAIVGYTNAGKSTLLNALTDAGITAADRLFDTLDPTTRRYTAADGFSVLLSDTVGFIRKLPHGLVEAFKATLDELKHADAILHVIDLSHPEWEAHVEVTERLVDELGAGAAPLVRVYNKMDRCNETPPLRGDDVAISAKTGEGLDRLIDAIRSAVGRGSRRVTIHVPYGAGGLIDELYRTASVENISYDGDAALVTAVCGEAVLGRLHEQGVTIE